MKIEFLVNGKRYSSNLSNAIDISIPLKEGLEQVNCFYAPPFSTSPVVAGDFIGSTQQGGPLNFLNVNINPHGNGTHTECVGHIAKETYTINQCLKKFWHLAEVISVYPKKDAGDRIITKENIETQITSTKAKALIIRTLPNDDLKLQMNYSGANPVYFDFKAIQYIIDLGIEHLLVDLPSVDREEDGGQLLSHKTFWNYPNQPEIHRTITELVYLPDHIKDGLYALNIQIASFEIDVSPSKPVLYEIIEV